MKFLEHRERLVPTWRRPRRASVTLPPAVDIAEAEDFVRKFDAENPGAGDLRERLAQVRASVNRTGTYEHTFPELQWAARARLAARGNHGLFGTKSGPNGPWCTVPDRSGPDQGLRAIAE